MSCAYRKHGSVKKKSSSEIVSSTAIRKDRRNFINSRKSSEGVVIFIRNDIECSEIILTEKTIVECQITRFKIGDVFYCLLNVHIPPYRTRLTMVNELSRISRKLKGEYANDEIILPGDFNMPNIIWTYNETDAGFLVSHRFLQQSVSIWGKTCSSMRHKLLIQKKRFPISEGKFLDFVFTSNVTISLVYQPTVLELVDRNSIHHNAVAIQIIFLGTVNNNAERHYNFPKIRLKESNRNEEQYFRHNTSKRHRRYSSQQLLLVYR